MNKKMSIEDRAKQFAPFASLRGYYDLVRQEELIKEDKRDLSETEAEIISSALNKIKKGMMVKVRYYKKDHYETITGVVFKFDETFKRLEIVKTPIDFEDIVFIEESR